MITERDRLMLALKGPDWYSHMSAKEALYVLNHGKRKRYKSMYALIDKHISIIMECFDKEQVVRIIKTWLSIYHLPLDASRLKTYEQFHQRFAEFVMANFRSIRNY